MLKIGRTAIAIAIAALALPAAAGSWPNLPARKAAANAAQPAPAKPLIAVSPRSSDGFVEGAGEAGWSLEQYSYFRTEEGPGEAIYAPRKFATSKPARDAAPANRIVNGFEYVGGDGGWQPAPHRLVWNAGRFAHSDECDHVIRTAKAATPEELESVRNLSPGA